MGSQRVGHDWETSLSLFTFMHWRRKWQPTPVFLPGESQGGGSLVGCRLWGRSESNTTDTTQQQQQTPDWLVEPVQSSTAKCHSLFLNYLLIPGVSPCKELYCWTTLLLHNVTDTQNCYLHHKNSPNHQKESGNLKTDTYHVSFWLIKTNHRMVTNILIFQNECI